MVCSAKTSALETFTNYLRSHLRYWYRSGL